MLKYVYLLLALVGLFLTWYCNIQFMSAGHGVIEFITAPTRNFATQSLAFDLLIATLAGCIWMVAEGRRVGIRCAWVYIVVSVTIAFAFAFPLFLFHRELRMANQPIWR